MGEYLALLGQVWYSFVFAAVVIAIAALSNAGVIRTRSHVAYPARGWAAILCMWPFTGGALLMALHAVLVGTNGDRIPWLLYPTVASMGLAVVLGVVLFFLPDPPGRLTPAWIRAARG